MSSFTQGRPSLSGEGGSNFGRATGSGGVAGGRGVLEPGKSGTFSHFPRRGRPMSLFGMAGGYQGGRSWMMPLAPEETLTSFDRYLDAAMPMPQPHELEFIPEGIDDMLLDRKWLPNPSDYTALSNLLGYGEDGVFSRPRAPSPIPTKRRVMGVAEMKQRLKSGDYTWMDFTTLSDEDVPDFLIPDPEPDPRFDKYSFGALCAWGTGAYYNPRGASVPGPWGNCGAQGTTSTDCGGDLGSSGGGGGGGSHGLLHAQSTAPAMQGEAGRAPPGFGQLASTTTAQVSTMNLGEEGKGLGRGSFGSRVQAPEATTQFGGGAGPGTSGCRVSATVSQPRKLFGVGVETGSHMSAAVSRPTMSSGIGNGSRLFGSLVPAPASSSTTQFGDRVRVAPKPLGFCKSARPAMPFGVGRGNEFGSLRSTPVRASTLSFGAGRGQGFGSSLTRQVPITSFGGGRVLRSSGTSGTPTPMATSTPRMKMEKTSPQRSLTSANNNRPIAKVTPSSRLRRSISTSTTPSTPGQVSRARQPRRPRRSQLELDLDIIPEPEIVYTAFIDPLTGRPRDARIKYKCTLCSQQYLQRCGYNVHYNTAHLGIRYFCEICSQAYVRKCSLLAHLGRANCSRQGRVKENQCGLCGNVYSTPGALKKHVNAAHPNQKGFRCDICGRMYRWKKDMNAHRRRHRRRT